LGFACYFVGPEPAHQEYPNVIYPGSHTEIYRIDYDGQTPVYDPSINRCYMVNNVDGSVVGYKYFNFSQTHTMEHLSLQLGWIPQGVDGEIEVWIDRPTEAEGGKLMHTLKVTKNSPQELRTECFVSDNFLPLEGKHALFFRFSSDVKGQSIATLCTLQFVPMEVESNAGTFLAIALAILAAVMILIVVKKRKK